MKNNHIDIRELARLLDLSITTVSRVLNGKSRSYRISEKTTERVIKTAREYNYVPSQIARGLKIDKTGTIGLIIPDISNPFFADIAASIEKEARAKDFSLILCDSEGLVPIEKELVVLLQRHKVEGMIIAPIGTNFDHVVQVYKSGLPLVIIDRSFPDQEFHSVTTDNYQGGYDATDYLISMGHKRIACIQGIQGSQVNKDRVQGYMDALVNNGIQPDINLIMGYDFSIENGYRQIKILYSSGNLPTAIFSFGNLITLGAFKAFNEMNLKVPDDVSLISFDEQPHSALLGTPMTTINQQKSEMGMLSVDILIRSINNKEFRNRPVNIKLKTNLIIRSSVRKV